MSNAEQSMEQNESKEQPSTEELVQNPSNGLVQPQLDDSISLDENLFKAINQNNPDWVELALAAGAQPNSQNVRGHSALSVALLAAKPNGAIIDRLLDLGASPLLKNRVGDTPLHEAAKINNVMILEKLIKKADTVNPLNNLGVTPLIDAVDKLLPESVDLLIRSGADIHIKTPQGVSAILLAGRQHNVKIMSQLLEAGANVEDADLYDVSVLHEAVHYSPRYEANGSEDEATQVVELLLKAGANPNRTAKSGTKPLATAAQFYNKPVIDLLIEYGADPNVHTIGGVYGEVSALMMACLKTDVEVVKSLVDRGADVNFENHKKETPLEYLLSARYENKDNEKYLEKINKAEEIIDFLLAAGAKLPESKRYLLGEFAVVCNSKTLIDKVAAMGWIEAVSPKSKTTALHAAVKLGRHEMVKYLIDRGASVDAQSQTGTTPLMLAQAKSCPEEVTNLYNTYVFLQNHHEKQKEWEKAKGFEEKAQQVQEAFKQIWLKTAQLLIEKGAHINAQDNKGRSALDAAVRTLGGEPRYKWEESDSEVLIDLLIAKGADIAQRDEQSNSPFILLVQMGHTELVKKWADRLIQEGKEADLKSALIDVAWTAPEHPDAVRSMRPVFEALIEKGALLDFQDEDGQTPVIVAAATNQEELCELLLELGANPDLKNNEGEVAIAQAIANNHPNISRILFAKGANPNMINNDGDDLVCLAYKHNCSVVLNQIVDAKRQWSRAEEEAAEQHEQEMLRGKGPRH